jgi:hypothetical protein
MGLARQVLETGARTRYLHCHRFNQRLSPCEIPMNTLTTPDSPPTDFVAFLAQRGGLSPEAAEHRLERWFGEYHARSSQRRSSNANLTHAPRPAALAF